MYTELLIATQNQGKQAELRAMLSPLGIALLTPDQVGLADFDVEETGDTFEENAELKAKAFAEAAKKPTIADDSGLLVDALGGKPGVYSKRVGQSDSERIQWVLSGLRDEDDRAAQFVAAICLYDPVQKTTTFFTGTVPGHISKQLDGDDGFGYDPIFIPEGYDQTFARLGSEVKNTMSHRGRAIQALVAFLSTT